MSGAANTFVISFKKVTDLFSAEEIQQQRHRRFIENLCSAKFSNVDGVLFLEKTAEAHYKWDFYNRDGSNAEMCGNAARCAAALILKFIPNVDPSLNDLTALKNQKVDFETVAGNVRGDTLSGSEVTILMPSPKNLIEKFVTVADEKKGTYFFVDSGVPHIVIKINDLAGREQLRSISKKLRFSPETGKAGSNITFYRVLSEKHIEAVTFERGVEDFTMACGTGAVASALAYMKTQNLSEAIVKVQMPGGLLKIATNFNDYITTMSGPAELTSVDEYNFKELI